MARRLTLATVDRISVALDPSRQIGLKAHPVIWQAERDYHFALKATEENGNLQNHLQRLTSIESAARKLKQLLQSEPLIYHILAADPIIDGHPTTAKIHSADRIVADQVGYDEGELFHALELVKSGASALLQNREVLRSARFDASSKDAFKSMERRLLWTPIFHFCTENSIKLTFYDNGSLFKALSILHEELDAPALKAGSLRRAIEEYVHEPSVLDEGEISIWHDAT